MTLSQALQKAYEDGFQAAEAALFNKNYGREKALEVYSSLQFEKDNTLMPQINGFLALTETTKKRTELLKAQTGRLAISVEKIKELSKAIKLAKEKEDEL